jgi:hypothetical protein
VDHAGGDRRRDAEDVEGGQRGVAGRDLDEPERRCDAGGRAVLLGQADAHPGAGQARCPGDDHDQQAHHEAAAGPASVDPAIDRTAGDEAPVDRLRLGERVRLGVGLRLGNRLRLRLGGRVRLGLIVRGRLRLGERIALVEEVAVGWR